MNLSPQALAALKNPPSSAKASEGRPSQKAAAREVVRRVRAAVTNSDWATFGNASTGYRTRSSASLTNLRDPQPAERKEAVRNSRFLRAKLGIFKALYENTARYSLGRGLMPTSSCADREWAQRADEDFRAWASRQTYDIREALTFFEAQKVVLPDVMCDGDAGAAPVINLDGQPAVQHFPSDVIGEASGESIFGNGKGRWRDGILRNAVGTPIAYRVLRDPIERMRDPSARAYWDYPARKFWHLGRQDRLNANRPLPWIHHGDQSGLNVLDMNVLEMQVAKVNAFFTGAVKSVEGGLSAGIRDLIHSEEQTISTGVDAQGNPTTKSVGRSFLNLDGAGGILEMEPGEEFQFFTNNRNAANFKELIEYFVADISIGFGLPSQFVWALTSLAGPHARLVLQQADWFFRDVADIMVSKYCQPVWEEYIAFRMNSGALRAPAPGTNWRAVHWQGPGSMTIDKGRDGKLHVSLIENLMGTRKSFFQETGKDGMTGLRECIEEMAQIRDIGAEFGLTLEQLMPALGKLQPAGLAEMDPEELAAAMAG
jgi:capsid protein